MKTDPRKLIEKVDMSVSQISSDGGYLNPEKFDEFYQILLETEGFANLLNDVRVVQMGAPQMEIDKIGFGNRMMRPAPSAGTPLNADQRYRPQFDQIALNTKKTMGEIFLPYDVLEDNIEKGKLEQTILQMAGKRIRSDLSEILILGDTSSEDDYLALTDGALARASHQISGSSISNIDKTLFKLGIDNMPSKFLQYRQAMRYYLSVANDTNYRDQLADRATQLGDDSYAGFPNTYCFGIKVAPEYHIPDSKMLLTYPQNVILGIQRNVTLRTKEEPTLDGVVMVFTMRFDVQVEEPNAAVVITGLDV